MNCVLPKTSWSLQDMDLFGEKVFTEVISQNEVVRVDPN